MREDEYIISGNLSSAATTPLLMMEMLAVHAAMRAELTSKLTSIIASVFLGDNK